MAADNVRKHDIVLTKQNEDFENLDNCEREIETLPQVVNQCTQALLEVGDAEQNFEDPNWRMTEQHNFDIDDVQDQRRKFEMAMKVYVKKIKLIDDTLRETLDRLPNSTSGTSNQATIDGLRLTRDNEHTLHRLLVGMGVKRFGSIDVELLENDDTSH